MAHTTIKSFVLLILLVASLVSNSAARIGKPQPSIVLSSSVPAGQLSTGAPGSFSSTELPTNQPTSTLTIPKPESKVPSVLKYVRHLLWDRESPGNAVGHQIQSGSPTFTMTSSNIILETVTSISLSTISSEVAKSISPSFTATSTNIIFSTVTTISISTASLASASTPLSFSSATSTITETVNGVVTIITTIIISSESAVGTLVPSSSSSAKSLTLPSLFTCTEALCTPSSSAFTWTCSDAIGCGFSTTLASYSCSFGIPCSLVPVKTTWTCSIPGIGNICTTSVALVPLPPSGSSPALPSVPGQPRGSSPSSPSPASQASGITPSSTKPSNPTSSTSHSAAASSPASNDTPGTVTTASSGTQCSDASCCPSDWDCNPSSTAAATVFDLLACPTPTSGSWQIACVPSSWASFITETNFLLNSYACPPYRTCVFPSTHAFATAGVTGGTTSTGSIPSLEIPCANEVAVCTSVFPSLTRLSQGSCLAGNIYSPLCQRCTDMKIPDDCPKTLNVPWPTTGSYYFCACSVDVTGLSIGSGSGPSGAAATCANWNSISTTEVLGSTTITTMVNPEWDTCEQPDVKTSCGTAASCTSMVRYTAESEKITIVEGGVTVITWIFWWGCQSDLCDASWWANLINAFCRLVGICHIPSVSGDGFPRPPWPRFPPVPDPLSFSSPGGSATTPNTNSKPSGSSSAPSSGSSSPSSSSSCSAVTVTDLIVYCFNTTISGGVFTTGCSTTSSFTTSGCSLTPIITTTTESATCSVVTVTDVSVGCYNITNSAAGFAATCNQTSTYLSTGCSLTPTTSTTTDDAPACSLSPNYNDPAIMSDLSIWLQQFPLTLPPDIVNITNFSITTPNATLPPSTSPAGWTTQEFLTTEMTGTNPATTQTEVVSESVDLWGGVTTIISGSITEYISATSSSTLAETTVSTITPVPSVITTTQIITSGDSAGKTVVVSEVEIIYGVQSSDSLGTSTSVLIDSEVSTLSATPSKFHATTSTNSFGEVESEEVGMIGTSTVTVSVSIISTIGSAANSLFGSSGPPFPSLTLTQNSAASWSSVSELMSSCTAFNPPVPTSSVRPDTLNCAIDKPYNIAASDINNWSADETFQWMNVTNWMINTFCGALVYSGSWIKATDTDPRYSLVKNGFCMVWPGASPAPSVAMHFGDVTFAIAYDERACDPKFPYPNGVSLDSNWALLCPSIFREKVLDGCASDAGLQVEQFRTIGGFYFQDCMRWTVVSVKDRPPDSLPLCDESNAMAGEGDQGDSACQYLQPSVLPSATSTCGLAATGCGGWINPSNSAINIAPGGTSVSRTTSKLPCNGGTIKKCSR